MAEQATKAMFSFFDENNDGGLSFEELKEGMASVGSKFTDEEIKGFFDKYDTDNNGIIDFNEFLALCIAINTSDSEKAIAQLFEKVDKDKNRSLTHAELREGIASYTGKDISDSEVTALIKQVRQEVAKSHNFTNQLLISLYSPDFSRKGPKAPSEFL